MYAGKPIQVEEEKKSEEETKEVPQVILSELAFTDEQMTGFDYVSPDCKQMATKLQSINKMVGSIATAY